MRQNCRDLQNKLGRATSCRKQDNYGRKTFGIWKSLKGPKSKIRRVYINIAGVEYTGSAAIEAARADTEARINRQFIPKNRDHSPEPFTLDFWSIPQTVQDVYASKGIRSLYSWQVEALSLAGVADGSKNFVFSTPTSSGKSLISEILLIRSLILKKRKAIVILPFISLVEEKCSDLTEKLCSIGYCCKAFHSVIPPVFNNDVDVAICTFEKASIMINLLITSGRMCQIGIVIVDELHYIGDPHRGFILEGIMSKVLTCPFDPESPPQIVGMSATLSNFPALSSWLNAIDYTCDFRPVPLKQHYVIRSQEVYNQHHQRCRVFPPNTNNSMITIQLVQEVVDQAHSVIVFVATKAWCVNLSIMIASELPQKDGERRSKLIEEIKESNLGNICPRLEKSIWKGVGYHNSDLSSSARSHIENAFRDGTLVCLCATSTIAAGINLPARRVIFRSQFVGLDHISVAQYQQMAGRAGRANLDDIGESFIICEGQSADVTSKVKYLVSAPPSAVESCLALGSRDFDKMARLLLDGICLKLSNDTERLIKLVSNTFWASLIAQASVDISNIVSLCVSLLLEKGFVQEFKGFFIAHPLGIATSASGLPISDALIIYESLNAARDAVCTSSPMHIAYLCAPLNSPFRIACNERLLHMTIGSLNSADQKIAIMVGVDPMYMFKSFGITLQIDSVEDDRMRRLRRFVLAKLLCEIVTGELSIETIAAKFNISPGEVHNLQLLSSTMANMSAVFCQNLHWDSLALLLAHFSQLLSYGCPNDLLPLFTIPSMTLPWARSLFDHDLRSPEDIADASVDQIAAALSLSYKKSCAVEKSIIDAETIHSAACSISEHRQLDPAGNPFFRAIS